VFTISAASKSRDILRKKGEGRNGARVRCGLNSVGWKSKGAWSRRKSRDGGEERRRRFTLADENVIEEKVKLDTVKSEPRCE
jgi:hypothetical protein